MAKKVDFAAGFNPVQKSKPVLDKDLFVDLIWIIENQSKQMREFELAIRKALGIIGDDSTCFSLNDDYYDATIFLLERYMHDNHQVISRWLTEGEKVTATYEVNGVRTKKQVETAEELYEYLLERAQDTENAMQVSEEELEQMF